MISYSIEAAKNSKLINKIIFSKFFSVTIYGQCKYLGGLIIFLRGNISGGMYNPAVSVMMTAAGKLPLKDLLPYILVQVAGGLCALELSKHIKIPKI